MISTEDIPKFMEKNIKITHKKMQTIKTSREYNQLLRDAPAFIFHKTNNFLQAMEAEYIVVLVPPNKFYRFEVLSHDLERKRIIVNNMSFLYISEENFNQIVMDYYPIGVT